MQYINIHTHKENLETDVYSIRSFSVINNNNIPSDKPFSVGVHPWDSEKFNFCHFDTLKRISNKKQFVAIGETGLDKIKGAEYQIQKNIFIYHSNLAENTKKPLIIHCVKYHNELLSLHTELKPKMPWIIHSFEKDIKLANEFIKRGIFLSFGPSLFNSTSNPFKYFSKLDKEFIFVETDESNHSIQEIYHKAAELRDIKLKDMAEIIKTNFKKCFGYVPVVK